MTPPEIIRIVFLGVAAVTFMWLLYLFLFNWNKDELVRTSKKVKEGEDATPKKSEEDFEVQMAKSKYDEVPEPEEEEDEVEAEVPEDQEVNGTKAEEEVEAEGEQQDSTPAEEESVEESKVEVAPVIIKNVASNFEEAARPKQEYAGRGRFNIKSGLTAKSSTPVKEESILDVKDHNPSDYDMPKTAKEIRLLPSEHGLIEEHSVGGNSAEEKPKKSLFEKAKEVFTSGEFGDEFGKIAGITPVIEDALKDFGIKTYKQLAQVPSGDIVELLHTKNIAIAERSSSLWSEQAVLAAQGDWKTLERFKSDLSASKKQYSSPRRDTSHGGR